MSLRTLTTFLVAIAISLTTQTAFAPPAVTTPPVANNDSATTPINTFVLIAVLANDVAASGNPINPKSVKIESAPSNGVATVLQNGQVRYTPASGFTSPPPVTFTYSVMGVRGPKSNVATVTVTVQPANVAPVANPDSATVNVNSSVVIPVLANDTDANGNATINPATVAIASAPTNGIAVSNPDGTVTYTPNANFSGTDSFTYNVQDTQGATSNAATVTVSVNGAPVADAGDDANAVTGQSVSLNGSGSTDPNGDTITFSWRFMAVPPASILTDASIVNPTTPGPSFTPDVDGPYELELTVTDPGGLFSTDTVIIMAATPNSAPNAIVVPENQTALVGTTVNLDGSNSNDDGKPNPQLTFQWSFTEKPLGSGLTDANITVSGPNGEFASFIPDVIGTYKVRLTVFDGELSGQDEAVIDVTMPNTPPNANAGDDVLVQLGNVATLNGSASFDPDDPDFPAPLTFQWSFVSVAAGSTLTNANITGADTAAPSFTPDQPGMYTLQLVVSDGADSDSDEVMVTANAAPVAVDDAYDVDEDTLLDEPAPGVLANDTDANNDTLTAVLDAGPSNAAPGSFNLNADGSFTYKGAENFNGDDSFTYHANDGSADSTVATVTITVNAVNDAPEAVDDPSYTTNEDGGALAGTSVLTNDTDEENDPLTAVLVSVQPANAQSFTFNSDGTFSYTPNTNFNGPDTFTYKANDGTSDSNVATATITVNPVNDAPSFTSGGNVTVNEDSGPHSPAWATAISEGPANEASQTLNFVVTNDTPGLFSPQPAISPSGVLTFNTPLNANGSAMVTVTLHDDGGTDGGGVDTSGPQTFTITVTPVNDAPSVTPPAAYAAHAHIGINIPDGATDLFDGSTITDVDGPGALPFSITPGTVASTNAGSAAIAANGSFSYNPPAGFTGANDTFTYQICDSGVPGIACTNATATVTVSGPRVWFVNNGLVPAGDGRLSSPFNTLAAADTAADANGDRIFVFTSASTYTGGFVLFTNQRLIGQGVADTTFDTALGITPPATSVARPAINGGRPQINGTITLPTGGTARGFNVNNTTTPGVSGSGATGLTVNQVSVTTTTGVAVNLLNSGGIVSFTSVSANGAANGIVLNNYPTGSTFAVTGTGTPGSGGTIQSTTGPGIVLTNAAG
ncbi:MAG: Ig-like domain-containing protein, partial [Gammaproteobacteria bacterium]